MLKGDWITTAEDMGDVCPIFKKEFSVHKPVSKATAKISARGVYTAELNGRPIGDFVLAPGWTQYEKRIQFQEYDITAILQAENAITLLIANGWYTGRIAGACDDGTFGATGRVNAVIAEIDIEYTDGSHSFVVTDDSWLAGESKLRFCDIYDGEIYDATHKVVFDKRTKTVCDNDKSLLVAQQGEIIREQERISPIALIKTPKGETVLDFGQNLTGYLEFSVTAEKGDICDFSFGEILDKDGNFYNENYRSAKCYYHYICKDGLQIHKPTHTFYGFRYVRVNEFPTKISFKDFTAIVVHSDMKRTGWLYSSDNMLNKLFSNVIWGQKSNYLDIPTDCPQRDERLGWTGDAQIFIRTACYNYDVRKFFYKWLGDVKIAQSLNKTPGAIPSVVPSTWYSNFSGSAWGDAVTICPWELYRMYGDKSILEYMYSAMKKWVDCISDATTTEGLWTGGWHYGDWLELAAEYGQCKGETRDELIATAFYAHSVSLTCKAGRVLGEDVNEYEKLYELIKESFIKAFDKTYNTQTEYIVALHFGLTAEPEDTARRLVDKIHNDGDKLQTGFVGTPYILHVLSKYGYSELAYKLLLRREYPSWLYPVTKGATTMWEHWDGIKPDGTLWPVSMNSYNHYAYGSVCDWVYGVACGINPVEDRPGFEEVRFAPVATDMLDGISAEFDSVFGKIRSGWYHKGGKVVYKITTPVNATAFIEGKSYTLSPGEYEF